jgi:hypothetical protein
VALTLALVVVSIGREPSVSAQELLARTVAAQEARLRPVPRPVVYQRLQVSRRAGVMGAGVASAASSTSRETQQTWEIWADTVHGRYRERVGAFAPIARRAAPDAEACGGGIGDATPAATPIGELESILCANGLRSVQPLSARAWSEWRGRMRGASERVRQNDASDDGPAALVLHTRLPGGVGDAGGDRTMRIREAELVVRADDWHPLAQRFTVEIDRQLVSYELRELSFEVVELASVAPAFFDERAAPPPAPVTPTATAAVEAVSEADVIAAEVQAWDALHRLGALRGEPVEIVRAQASPRVEVRGLASSPERKQAIVDAISAIPLVTASISTVDEALAANAATPNRAAPPPTVGGSTMVQTGTVPILPLIEAYLQPPREPGFTYAGPPVTEGGAQAIATDVVSLSREVMADAWALERLARFAQGLDAAAVRPSSRRTLERMASELAAGAAAKLDALGQRVAPIVAPLVEDSSSSESAHPADSERDWTRLALRVFERAREADETTRRLFTESDAGLVELGPSARQLIAACTSGRKDALTLSDRLTSQSQ